MFKRSKAQTLTINLEFVIKYFFVPRMPNKDENKVFVKAHYRKKKKRLLHKSQCETCRASGTYCIFHHSKQDKIEEPTSVSSHQSSDHAVNEKLARYKQLALSSDSSQEEFLPIKRPPPLQKRKKTLPKVTKNCETRLDSTIISISFLAKKKYLLSSTDSDEEKSKPGPRRKLHTGLLDCSFQISI